MGGESGDDSERGAPSIGHRPALVSAHEPIETVDGVPLEKGERVVHYFVPDHKLAKALHIAIGVLLAPLLFGIVLIVYGVMYEKWHLKFVALTDRRIITKHGNKAERWLYLSEVTDLRAKRETNAGGGVLAAVAVAAQAAQSAAANKAAKTNPRFWAGAQAIIVQGAKGSLAIEGGIDPVVMGPALANAVFTDGYVARLPTANHPR